MLRPAKVALVCPALVLACVASGETDPKTAPSTHEQAPPPAEVSEVPADEPDCSGEIRAFRYEFHTGSVDHPHGYMIKGRRGSEDGKFDLEYRWKGWPEVLDEGGVVLEWKGSEASEDEAALMGALSTEFTGTEATEIGATAGTSRVEIRHAGGCERAGEVEPDSFSAMAKTLHERGRDVIPKDSKGRRALGYRARDPVYPPG